MSADATSERTCVGCRAAAPREDVVRLVHAPDGSAAVDHPPRLGGRGAWVHASRACLERAARKGSLSRALGADVVADADTLAGEVRRRVEDRVAGMIAAGRGGRRVAVGTEAVREALARGRAHLLVVAADARGDREALEGLARRAAVPAVAVLDKRSLGRALGRDEVGVAAVDDPGLAAALVRESAFLSSLSAQGPSR